MKDVPFTYGIYSIVYLRFLVCFVGTWLVFLPVSWGVCLAANPTPSVSSLGIILVGAFLVRGSACTIGDIFDKDIDKQVRVLLYTYSVSS